MANTRARYDSIPYQLFMLALCLFALAALAIDTLLPLDRDVRTILEYADLAVCGIFLFDFVRSLAVAEDRIAYLRTWGWLDLLSSIPTLDIARWGRLARVLRIARVFRGVKASRIVADLVLRQRAQSTFLAASLTALLLIVFCSIAVLQFENHADSNILTGGDALWWAFATVTTVGYGDFYPVTGEGRVVAVVLMSAGLALYGTLSGLLAAWFIQPEDEDTEQAIRELRDEVRRLREERLATRD